MDTYIYQADIYCEDCASKIKGDLSDKLGRRLINLDDSDEYPVSANNSEADVPQHCGECHVFLDNPLTANGARYVADKIRDYYVNKDGDYDVIAEWIEAYRDYEPVAKVLHAVEVLEL